jgi:hypothetical protein
VTTSEPKSLLCADNYFFGALDTYHVENFFLSRTTQITYKNLSPNAIADIQKNGIRLFLFCDGIVDSLSSIFNTLLMFAGGLSSDPDMPIFGSHIPPYMEEANVNFVNQTMGW